MCIYMMISVLNNLSCSMLWPESATEKPKSTYLWSLITVERIMIGKVSCSTVNGLFNLQRKCQTRDYSLTPDCSRANLSSILEILSRRTAIFPRLWNLGKDKKTKYPRTHSYSRM